MQLNTPLFNTHTIWSAAWADVKPVTRQVTGQGLHCSPVTGRVAGFARAVPCQWVFVRCEVSDEVSLWPAGSCLGIGWFHCISCASRSSDTRRCALWRLISERVSHLLLMLGVVMWSLGQSQTDNETQIEIAQVYTFIMRFLTPPHVCVQYMSNTCFQIKTTDPGFSSRTDVCEIVHQQFFMVSQ